MCAMLMPGYWWECFCYFLLKITWYSSVYFHSNVKQASFLGGFVSGNFFNSIICDRCLSQVRRQGHSLVFVSFLIFMLNIVARWCLILHNYTNLIRLEQSLARRMKWDSSLWNVYNRQIPLFLTEMECDQLSHILYW